MPVIPLSASVGNRAVNRPNDVRAVKQRLVELGMKWLVADSAMGGESIKAIMLFQAMKNGLNRVEDPRNDGRIDPNGDTHLWLQAENAPRWQLMPPGGRSLGWVNDELADLSDQHDYGCSWLAQALNIVGEHYRADFLQFHPTAALIRVNDVSLPRGGFTPAHASHQAGLCCDIKLPRLSGQTGGINYNDPSYDQLTTRAILEACWMHAQTTRIFFNDPVFVAEGLCQAMKGHDNHIHYEVKPPLRVMPVTRPRPLR